MKQKGIRKKAALTVTLLVVSSLTLLGMVLSGLIFMNQKSQLLHVQREVLNYAINEMSWDMHELEMYLNIAATGNDLVEQNSKEQHDTLSRLLTRKDIKSHDILEELILLDSTGKELSRVSRTAVYSASDLGERSDTHEFTVPKESGQIYYGPMMYDEETFEPRITMSMPIPDIRSNEIKGVIIGKIRLNRIWENAVTRSFGKAGTIFITNASGKIVAHPDPSVIYLNTFFSPEKPEGIQPGLNGKKTMLVSGNYYMANRVFTVFAVLPFSEVLGLSLETLSTTAVFLLIFILPSIALSYLAANRIVRPIESLADNARSITEGKLVSTIQVGDSDEIGDLSIAFNTMTSRLFDTISSLKSEIAERKQAEEKIVEQNELMNNILNSLTHPFYVIDVNTYNILLANKASHFGSLSGTSTCYALTHEKNAPCDEDDHPCVIKKIQGSGKAEVVEHIHHDKEGRPHIMEIHGYPILDAEGNITKVIEYNLDISARKNAEKKIKASLREKEVLLREIHHRVKNNMQIISSLLNLQASSMDDKKHIEILSDSQNRIRSMSLIHEKLYNSTNLAQIDIKDYIKDLSSYILQFYQTAAGSTSLNIETDEIWMGIDTAIPCGLIINELLSNSLKYAFPENRQGEINIRLRKSGESSYSLTISDNGVGIPDDIDFRNTKTLGLQLVTTLAEDQLQGTLELDRSSGTEFRINFSEVKYKERLEN